MAHKGVQLLGPELPDVTLYQSYGNFRRPAAAALRSWLRSWMRTGIKWCESWVYLKLSRWVK